MPPIPGRGQNAGAGAGNAPAGGGIPVCNVPSGYQAASGGGASSPDNVVYACPLPDGTFNVINARSFTQVASGVTRDCLDQYGDVTFEAADDPVCVGPQAGPSGGSCALPKDQPFVMCPPSNGVTVNYFIDPATGSYGPDFTTQSPDCANEPNVYHVGANSPYCGGSFVQGSGGGPPELVACLKGPGVVDVHSGGADFTLLAADVPVSDIEARFPGKRYITVTGMFCSPLVDLGIAAAPGGGQAASIQSQSPSPTTPAGGQAGSIPTQPLQSGQGLPSPGGSPWPAYGSPIGVPAPGYGGGIPTQPMPAPVFKSSAPMACSNAPKPMAQWVEDCPGMKQARGY